jgi:glycosyltransferase involved in cell wall biosynthesis
MLARAMLGRLRDWDRAASARVDRFVAISHHIAERIRRCYGRDSTVIYPPVDETPIVAGPRGNAYVTVSQLVPYKRVDLLDEAFRMLPERELRVIGEGPERGRIEASAPRNVRFLGRVASDVRDRVVADARAFVFAAQEDFGIAPLEAQALGVPVIAYAGGAASETIRGLEADAPTGVLFDAQSAPAIADAVRRFEQHGARITPDACRENARRFSPERFRRELEAYVAACIDARDDAAR